jgi:SAM-dependent methyltransferase
VTLGYFNYSNKFKLYNLTKLSRKWCLKNSRDSLYYQQIFNKVCWQWMSYLPTYVRTGIGLRFHRKLNAHEWGLYQKGMANIALPLAKSLVGSTPKLKCPERMLDIGGSHGFYSAEYCKKYPGLKADILDLPQAVDEAELLLRRYYAGTQIEYRKGDALTYNFGQDQYDLVLMSNLMHHFSAKQSLTVSKKVYNALKPRGYFVIQEFAGEGAKRGELVGAVLDLFFGLSSSGRGWTTEELVNLHHTAGFLRVTTKKSIFIPGYIKIIGQK